VDANYDVVLKLLVLLDRTMEILRYFAENHSSEKSSYVFFLNNHVKLKLPPSTSTSKIIAPSSMRYNV
jgi:hypothetical protein